MDYTNILKLKKPSYDDPVDIKVFNENFDTVDAMDARVSNLINEITDNPNYAATAEVVDIRTGYEGTIHNTAGDAVRNLGYEIRDLRNSLADFIDADAVDGLFYENNKLYLTANGEIVSEPVEIVGGSGGGSGSSSGSYIITLKNTLPSRVIAVSEGTEVKLGFDYYSVDDEGIDDGPGICTITINGIKAAVTSVEQGNNLLDITQYLKAGNSTVRIKVENSEGNSKTIVYTISIVSLSLTTTYPKISTYSGAVGLPYTVSGAGEKTVHFIMDGIEIGNEVVTSTGRSRVYPLGTQSDGPHILEVYAEVEVEGMMLKSNTLQLGMLWYSSTTTEPYVLVMSDRNKVEQGETLNIDYLIYDPYLENTKIRLQIINEAGSVYSEQEITVDQSAQTWTTQDYPVGNTVFQITNGTAIAATTVEVIPSTFEAEIIQDSLVLEFTAAGRNNNEDNPESWNYKDIHATFEGFGWAGADGWLQDNNGQTVLRFLPGDLMNIPFMPFATDCRTNGYTIEAELASHNVQDYDSLVVSCFSGGRGFKIQSQKASFSSEQSSVSMLFKEDSKIRVTFVVEQRNLNRFVYIYINGVMCGITQYPDNDDFRQPEPVGVTIGADSCGLDLYTLRFYNKGLTRDEQLNNFICDRPTLDERRKAYQRNDILNDANEVSIETLPLTIPYMVLGCEQLPQYKGDKKNGCTVIYVDPLDPNCSFTAEGVQLNVQGTSSAGYPVKNEKVKLKSGITYTATGEHADGFPISPGSIPVDTLCLKADYASSENANNVMLVDFYEDTCPYTIPPKQEDSRVRQGIEGKPIVVFWNKPSTNETVFVGKFNMNNDKSNEDVFGFNNKYPLARSWEFCNNTSNRVLFLESDFGDGWTDDFESRYPEDDFDYTSLKRVTDWVVQFNRDNAKTEEEKQGMLTRFKEEFDNYFVRDAMLFFYLFTEVFLMVDNRAKNMFLTTYDGEHWLPLPYDMDTAIGINNEGSLVFEYNLEDTDIIGEAGVYNGQKSVLWQNIRDAFQDELREMYNDLRSEGTFSYEVIRDKMNNHQEVWPEALWNEDAFTKYLQPYLLNGEEYLAMLQGDKKSQRDWWLFNGFRYRDSKYMCGDAKQNHITLRCYRVGNITITPYSHIYPWIKYGSAEVHMRGERNKQYEMICPLDEMNDTEVYIYSADRLSSVGDLSHLNVGLAEFSAATKLQEIILGSNAEGYQNTQLNTLTVGNNELLTYLNIENCIALSKPIDVSGCHGLKVIKAKGSKLTGLNLPNGGHLTTLELPETITNFTIKNQKNFETLDCESYANISTLNVENTPNIPIEDIILGCTPTRVRLININWQASNEEAVAAAIEKLTSDKCFGMDANGNEVKKAVVTGYLYIDTITDSLLETINDAFPELIVVVGGKAKYFIRYLNWDNSLLYRYIAVQGDDAIDPVLSGYIDKPIREDTVDSKFNYLGWNNLPKNIQTPVNIIAKYDSTYRVQFRNNNEEVLNEQWIKEGNAAVDPVEEKLISKPTKDSTEKFVYTYKNWDKDFTNVTSPLILYPVFTAELRKYWVYFMNGAIKLYEEQVPYGQLANYPLNTNDIKKLVAGEESPYYEFATWSRDTELPITGTTFIYAEFVFNGYIEDSWEQIIENIKNGNIDAYGLGGRKILEFNVGGIDEILEMEIVGKNQDELAITDENYNNGKPTAAISFITYGQTKTKKPLNTTKNEYDWIQEGQGGLNDGGYINSDARKWLNSELLAVLPEAIRMNIKPVTKLADLGYYYYMNVDKNPVACEDSVWIPSAAELGGDSLSYVIKGQGSPYPLFTTDESRKKSANGSSTYITRSSDISFYHQYAAVDSMGNWTRLSPGTYNGLIFGFCL